MAVVFKGNNGGNKKSPLGAWIGYGAVGVFGIAVIAVTLFGGPEQPNPMDSAYRYEDYKDLADMPFSDDAAEAELLASVRYGDIAKNDLINALFSEEDKEARQAEDKANGAPPPPDEEYAEAAKEKEKVRVAKKRYRQSRQAAIKARAERTTKGSLSSSSGVRASGGGSGVSSTIWRADDKQRKNSSSGSANVGGQSNRNLLNDVKGGGRGGFMAAYDKSRAAANSQDNEEAHELAADAFQNAGDLEGDLKGDLEDMAAKMDLDKAIGAIDKDKGLANTLDEKLSDAKDNADNKKEKKDYKCDGAMLNGKMDMGCIMGDLAQGLFDVAKQALTSMLTKGKEAETAAENASILSETKTELTDVENKLKDTSLSPEARQDLLDQKKDLDSKIAYFSTNGATSKGWDKFTKKQSKKKEKESKK